MSYWDSSALVKLYVQEWDSAVFRALALETDRLATGSLTGHDNQARKLLVPVVSQTVIGLKANPIDRGTLGTFPIAETARPLFHSLCQQSRGERGNRPTRFSHRRHALRRPADPFPPPPPSVRCSLPPRLDRPRSADPLLPLPSPGTDNFRHRRGKAGMLGLLRRPAQRRPADPLLPFLHRELTTGTDNFRHRRGKAGTLGLLRRPAQRRPADPFPPLPSPGTANWH